MIRTTSLNDGLWVRHVDVAAFFDRRGFATDDELVVDAGDLGVWALGASGCSRADREPDVSLSAGDLGAVSLGGHRLRAMWRAGRVREHRAGAVDRFDAMLAVDPLPYCVVQF